VVHRGDTLWGICDSYFQNPYQWPRLWSYNPQIKNPNWIYPGDEIRLREGGEASTGAGAGEGVGLGGGGKSTALGGGNGMSLVDRRRQVPNGTVFLRDTGWVHDSTDEVWGAVSGSDKDTMFLSTPNEIYLSVQKGHDVRVGQELTVFRPRTTAAAGQIVVSEATMARLGGRFEAEEIEARSLKGKEKPVRRFNVVREKPSAVAKTG